MVLLLEVFSELFRSFGYATRLGVELEGVSGRKWPVALVAEKDHRHVAVATWLDTRPLPDSLVDGLIDLVKDAGCDSGLLLSLGAVPDALAARAGKERVQAWDSRRIIQELGTAVLHETCPSLWEHVDPLVAARPSRILETVREEVLRHAESAAAPPAPSPAAPPAAAGPSPALDPALMFAPILAEAPPVPPPRPTPDRNLLRTQVAKPLALSLVKNKLRHVDRTHLRLVPYYVFDFEVQLLVEGSLKAEARRGRLGVDAALKRVQEWTHPLDTGPLPPDGVDVDEKKVRVAEADAKKLLVEDLRTRVTRDVTTQEDESEWSVVVRRKVTLAEDDVKCEFKGLYWVPVWRVTAREGSMEIDAVTGQVVFEEVLEQRADALLL